MTTLDKIGVLFRGRRFSVHVYVPPSVAVERLHRFIATGQPSPHDRFRYTARVSGNCFRLERESTFWKQSPPVLIGEITQGDGYTEASGAIQLSSGVVWTYLSLIATVFAGGVVMSARQGGEFSIFFVVALTLFSAVFFGVFFKLTALKDARGWSEDISALETILEAEVLDGARE